MEIPVYAFTGFLDSGKTKFIQQTLEDPRFNAGERTLLLVCEEGEETYDLSAFPHKTVFLETVAAYADLSAESLETMREKHRAERVVLELNGMKPAEEFFEKMPPDWVVAQEVCFADAGTILSYNTNLRSLVVDKLQTCELAVFNRMQKGADVMPYHKLVRALNRRADIIYDYADGSTEFDEIEDPLPFDLNAPVIEIADDDYALWYRDATEEPKKYHGKTVRFKAQVARLRKLRDGYFAPGRFVMTCCEEDITFMGVPCRYPQAEELKTRDWIWLTASIEVKHHQVYHGVGPILTAVCVEPAEKPTQEVATF